MIDIRSSIEKIKLLISSETDERKLMETGELLIDQLREAWRQQSSDFIEQDISELQNLSKKLKAIREFREKQEEFSYIKDKEGVEEMIGDLYPLSEQLQGMKVAERINKEIRELLERKSALPSRPENLRSSQRISAIRRLNSDAPKCKKCDSPMVIREGNADYFWGCSTFPQCWGKRYLSSKELDQLPD